MATGRVDVRAEPGWRRPRLTPSLAEVYRTVPVGQPVWWRKALAFAGPGYLVAVGYMDPGNWATDLAGGSAFGDRKSTRLNSSHGYISYAVFCLKKKKSERDQTS